MRSTHAVLIRADAGLREQRFDLVGRLQFAGLLITEQYLDRRAREAILSYTWEGAWKCWKKSEYLINYERNRRGEKGYYQKFEKYYRLCEKHRIDNGYDEPKL